MDNIGSLINEAYNSKLEFRMSAVLLYKKKMITKPCINVETSRCRGKSCLSIHAEANALLNFYGKNLQFDNYKNKWCLNCPSKKLNLLVIRINKKNELCNSRPCYHCLKMMQSTNIKKVYYSIDNEIIYENVNDMLSIQISSATINLQNKNRQVYFENLLNETRYIKKKNLKYFIAFNFINIFPNYKIKYNKNLVSFYNDFDILITTIIII